MNFEKLEQKIKKATKQAFIEMFDKHQAEEIYAFALYSDGGGMTVCPSTNTMDFLNQLSEEEKKELTYYKFEPAEWKYEMKGADKAFDEICEELRTEREKNDFENESLFVNFRNRLFQTCINALKKLKQEDFFKNIIGKDVFLLFSVSDYEFESKELENIIITLNDNGYKEEYLEWMKTWEA